MEGNGVPVNGSGLFEFRILFQVFFSLTYKIQGLIVYFPFTPVGAWRITHTNTQAKTLADKDQQTSKVEHSKVGALSPVSPKELQQGQKQT